MTFKKIALLFLSTIVHLLALVVIGWAFWPVASWYLNHRPILGVDFYNTATFIKFFKENVSLLPNNYLDFWYGGSPIYGYHVMNWFRIYGLVAQFLPLLAAIKWTSLISMALLVIFLYLTAFKLSKHHFVSLLVALFTLYSVNLYGSLTWGGSLPYFANQFFLPLVLWFIVSYLETGNRRWFFGAAVVLTLAIAGHIGNAGAFVLPISLILLLIGGRRIATTAWMRFKDAGFLLLLLGLMGYKYLSFFSDMAMSLLGVLFQKFHTTIPKDDGGGLTAVTMSDTDQAIAEFTRGRFHVLFQDIHPGFYWLLVIAGLFLVSSLILGKNRRQIFSVFAWIIIGIYAVGHVYLNSRGINFLAQGWYRAFWHFPVILSLLIAALFGVGHKLLSERHKYFCGVSYFLIAIVSLVFGIWQIESYSWEKTMAKVEEDSSISSAHPQVLDLVKSDSELQSLRLYPEWMNIKDKNYRLYVTDAQVNVWWNALYDVPLVRGYLDPPGNISQHFLLDQAVGGDGLVKNYKYPEKSARNMALYYIDWYAIKYAEGGHSSQSPNNPPSTYLKDVIAEETAVETRGVYRLYQTESGRPEIHEDVPQTLNFYRFADDIVSPIVTISNSPALLCVCDYPAYESLIKILSMHNLNSRYVVSSYTTEAVDSLSKKDLEQFDLLILSNYHYRNRGQAHRLLGDFLKSGGKLFVDTGGETSDSSTSELPDWLPFAESERKGMGKEWELSVDFQNSITKAVIASEFSPPVFDGNEWSLSYPISEIDASATVLLSHQGKPLLIDSKYSNGQVIWSGMNLGYHVQYYTDIEESQLYVNILQSLLPMKLQDSISVTTEFAGDREIKLRSDGMGDGKGILVKRQMYDQWQFRVNGKSAKGYLSGPSFPGFIYIPLSGEKKFTARVIYVGQWQRYVSTALSWLVVLVLMDMCLFDGFFISKRLEFLQLFVKKHTNRWWEKDE